MGRIFETRKHTMMARWDRMSRAFTRVAKDITIAVKTGGPSPENNPTLRRAMQNARAVNMPKDKVQSAIARASGQGAESWTEAVYEGYAPHGVAIIVETATDNPTRTVANVRSHFVKGGGNMGATGSVGFLFRRMGVFRLKPDGINQDQLEFDLIDHGMEEMGESKNDKGETELVVRCAFADFGQLQRAIEERSLVALGAQSEYVPGTLIELGEAAAAEVMKLIERLEEDDDVQRVGHNLA